MKLLLDKQDQPVIVSSVTQDEIKQEAPVEPEPVEPKSRMLDDMIAFLQANREYQSKSGRELESIEINGKTATYKTWNKAKKSI